MDEIYRNGGGFVRPRDGTAATVLRGALVVGTVVALVGVSTVDPGFGTRTDPVVRAVLVLWILMVVAVPWDALESRVVRAAGRALVGLVAVAGYVGLGTGLLGTLAVVVAGTTGRDGAVDGSPGLVLVGSILLSVVGAFATDLGRRLSAPRERFLHDELGVAPDGTDGLPPPATVSWAERCSDHGRRVPFWISEVSPDGTMHGYVPGEGRVDLPRSDVVSVTMTEGVR